ncbi:MAG TPA: ABC transporter permease [Candidatus Methylomirabilis sp.]|nr:ABC transporter permease [Candidatus Methylomirabilis sp.]
MRGFWKDFTTDLAFGLRQIRSNVPLALICISVLAIGIGAATAVFTVLYDAILRPLPYHQTNSLVYVHNEFPSSHLQQTEDSPPDFRDLSSHPEIFSETAAYYFNDLTMTGAGSAQHVDVVNTSAGLFPMLGIRPELGRVYAPEEDRFGVPKVAILSDALWRSAFEGDRNAIGRSVELDGLPYQIVGVMPADFNFPYPATQMWVPLALPPAEYASDARGGKFLQMVGRLSPGLKIREARGILDSLSHAYAAAYPTDYPEKDGWHFSIQPLVEQRTSSVRDWLLLAFAAAACVLFIACVNVSGLLSVHAGIRQKEWAVRAALGAGRGRLIRQILTETSLFVFSGGAAGLYLAILLIQAGGQFNPTRHMFVDQLGPIHNATVEVWTFIFALAVCVLATFLASALPAMGVFRAPLDQMLRASTRTSTRATGGRGLLVAGQIGIAVALLFTATSLTRSVVKLLDVPPGFSPEHVWTGIVQLPRPRFTNGSKASEAFFQELVKRVSALPGVESASAVNALPFSNGGSTAEFEFPNRPKPTVRPTARVNVALPGYFETMKIPLLEGRTFNEEDVSKHSAVAIVNEAFAKQYFPGEDPIGKLEGYNGPTQIIGVVGDVLNGNLAEQPQPELYSASAYSAAFLVVRTKGNANITSSMRDALASVDKSVALFHVEMMAERVEDSLRLRRFVAWLVNSLAVVGLLLAALGLYATLAHLVELRRREIAIRMALGASRGDIRALVGRHSLTIAAAGLLPGILLSLVAARATQSFFFGITALDPWIVGGTIAGFFLLALMASWNPARRASQVDALSALREE